MTEQKVEYQHLIIKGTSYEAGYQLGSKVKDDRELIQQLTSPFMGGPKLDAGKLATAKEALRQFCPGTNEEIRGFADAVGARWEDIVYYYTYLQMNGCHCSQIAITPDVSTDGHCYLARNYEFAWGEHPLLITSEIDDQYKQIGFACQLFGRYDGMNEKGLCVTTSAGVINPPYHENGFVFPVVVRAILNQCDCVSQAVELFDQIPFADYRNFMIVDAQGNAVLIEAAAGKHIIRQAGPNSMDKVLASTNHYSASELQDQYKKMQHSVIRSNAIHKWLHQRTKISKQDLKSILSTAMPEGLCCHYYQDGMGTMWSIVFDATEQSAAISFGSPDTNPWQMFSINEKDSEGRYEAILTSEPAPKDFWKTVE